MIEIVFDITASPISEIILPLEVCKTSKLDVQFTNVNMMLNDWITFDIFQLI